MKGKHPIFLFGMYVAWYGNILRMYVTWYSDILRVYSKDLHTSAAVMKLENNQGNYIMGKLITLGSKMVNLIRKYTKFSLLFKIHYLSVYSAISVTIYSI